VPLAEETSISSRVSAYFSGAPAQTPIDRRVATSDGVANGSLLNCLSQRKDPGLRNGGRRRFPDFAANSSTDSRERRARGNRITRTPRLTGNRNATIPAVFSKGAPGQAGDVLSPFPPAEASRTWFAHLRPGQRRNAGVALTGEAAASRETSAGRRNTECHSQTAIRSACFSTVCATAPMRCCGAE